MTLLLRRISISTKISVLHSINDIHTSAFRITAKPDAQLQFNIDSALDNLFGFNLTIVTQIEWRQRIHVKKCVFH